MSNRAERSQGGFTLIELMISLVLFAFAIAGVLAAAVSMSQGLHEQRAAVDAETAARVPLDFLQDALRQASPGAPSLNIQDAGTCNVLPTPGTVTGAITVTNGTGLNGSDILDVVYASGAVVTSLRTPYIAGTTTVTVGDTSQLAVGDYIVISNMAQGHIVKITGIASPVLTLAAQCGTIVLPAGGYAAGALVIRAQHAIFYLANVSSVVAGATIQIPTLMMNPTGDPAQNAMEPVGAGEPLAEGIEDFQVALGIDSAADGVSELGTGPSDDEWYGNHAGDTGSTASVWNIATLGTLRAVRITLVARTTSAYIGAPTAFVRPAAEDNPVGTVNDSFRRRVLKTSAEIRNVSVSP